jgi:hypothetical protein
MQNALHFSFGNETYDHIPNDVFVNVVKTRKAYELQDIVFKVWLDKKRPEANKNLRAWYTSGKTSPPDKEAVEVWLEDTWKIRRVEEVIHRMIELIVESILSRLKDSLTDEDIAWLQKIPRTTGRDYSLIYKGIWFHLERFISYSFPP